MEITKAIKVVAYLGLIGFTIVGVVGYLLNMSEPILLIVPMVSLLSIVYIYYEFKAWGEPHGTW